MATAAESSARCVVPQRAPPVVPADQQAFNTRRKALRDHGRVIRRAGIWRRPWGLVACSASSVGAGHGGRRVTRLTLFLSRDAMPKPFRELTVDQVADLANFPWARNFERAPPPRSGPITRSSRRSQQRSRSRHVRFHQIAGFRHCPARDRRSDRHIWTGRNFNQPPARTAGFSNSQVGPFAIEMSATSASARPLGRRAARRSGDGPREQSSITCHRRVHVPPR